MDADRKFQTFEDLEVYRVAREFRKAMYAVTRKLPDFEKFELVSQIRRAAVSLTNNVAEGHGRFHYLDQIKFMLQARGSLQELIDDLNVCVDEKYLTEAEVESLRQIGWQVSKLLGGYIRYLRKCKSGENLVMHESSVEYGRNPEDFPDATM
ncbi:MAG: four helix bundle protein [Verrucomicrobia bacterium]|nr:four helix bundle protein [Verrucomicrobiota bacterium]